MKLALILLFIATTPPSLIIRAASITNLTQIRNVNHYDGEINRLVEMLYPTTINGVNTGPNPSKQESVERKLVSIANKSSQARMKVIQAMIILMNDLTSQSAFSHESAWQAASNVLADLRAVEAIEALVRHFDQAMPVVSMTLGGYPPARALYRMGNVAIPKLKELLLNSDQMMRSNSASALGLIGGEKAEAALQTALKTETNEQTINRIKYALSQIEKSKK